MPKKNPPEVKQGNNYRQIPDAIEGAYIVLLAQNAFLISKPILEIGRGNQILILQVIIILISLTNFFNIAAGWLSDRLIIYTSTNLFWDIVSLAIFFVLVQSLLDTYNYNFSNIYYILTLTSVMYTLISIVNITWNNIEMRNSKQTQSSQSSNFAKLLKQANLLNFISLFFAALMGIVSISFHNEWLSVIAFALWFANWLFVIVYYTWNSARLK